MLFLINKNKPDHGFEVVSFDKEHGIAVLRGKDDVYVDRNFRIADVKRYYSLTDVRPAFLKEKHDA